MDRQIEEPDRYGEKQTDKKEMEIETERER